MELLYLFSAIWLSAPNLSFQSEWGQHSSAAFWKRQENIQRLSYYLPVRKEDIGGKGMHACSAG